jgi:hypothetical protein
MQMSQGHHVSYFNNVKDGQRKATCACGQTSGWQDNPQEVEDWRMLHEANVQRALVHLRRRNPSMEDQADYYRTMVELALDEKEQATWRQLADELDTRLGRNAPPSEQTALEFG